MPHDGTNISGIMAASSTLHHLVNHHIGDSTIVRLTFAVVFNLCSNTDASDFSKLEVGLLSGRPERAQGEAMKRSRFSEEQIAYALRLAESGTPVVDVCRQIGVSEATYYTWKKWFGDLGVSELRRLRMLEDENARLKRIVADLTLDKQILQEVVKKKL